jgi:hypothetical protein
MSARRHKFQTKERFGIAPKNLFFRVRRRLQSQGLEAWRDSIPAESGSGVYFSAGCDVLVARYKGQRVPTDDTPQKTGQRLVLGVGKSVPLQALHFNADRVIIAVVSAAVGGSACMPCSVIATNELKKAAVATNKEVGRNLQSAEGLKVGVRLPVQLVTKKLPHLGAAVIARGKTDRVNYHQIDTGPRWTGPEIGRGLRLGQRIPTLLPKTVR